MFSYRSIKNILENNLEQQPVDSGTESKIIQIPSFRFARDPADYKSSATLETSGQNGFMEKLEKMHPYSKYGNAMCGSVWDVVMADQIMEDEIKRREAEKNKILSALAEQ